MCIYAVVYLILLLICDAVHNAMMAQQCNTNAYCMCIALTVAVIHLLCV